MSLSPPAPRDSLVRQQGAEGGPQARAERDRQPHALHEAPEAGERVRQDEVSTERREHGARQAAKAAEQNGGLLLKEDFAEASGESVRGLRGLYF